MSQRYIVWGMLWSLSHLFGSSFLQWCLVHWKQIANGKRIRITMSKSPSSSIILRSRSELQGTIFLAAECIYYKYSCIMCTHLKCEHNSALDWAHMETWCKKKKCSWHMNIQEDGEGEKKARRQYFIYHAKCLMLYTQPLSFHTLSNFPYSYFTPPENMNFP